VHSICSLRPAHQPASATKIIERAGAGEDIKVADVKEAIKARKQLSEASNSARRHSSEGEQVKSATTAAPTAAPTAGKLTHTKVPRRRSSHLDIQEVWNAALPADHTKLIDSIDLKPLLAAMPDAWWPDLEKHVAEHQQQQASASRAPTGIVDDDRIPDSLLRSQPVKTGGVA
jgi:hypothetical protein